MAQGSMTTDKKSKWYHGICGLGPNFAIFNTSPDWVDKSLPAGNTPQRLASKIDWGFLLTGKYIIYSINLVWLIMAIGVYLVFPYDYEVSKHWDAAFGEWIAVRALLNVSLVLMYYGYWHMGLYWFGWSHRPFNPNQAEAYRWSKLIHNIWYSTLGAIQWTFWEAMMLNCYATGRMPYVSDQELLDFPMRGMLHVVGWTIAVPLYREVQFYFAHRLIHIRALYTYVHSVHHRNTDIEPFSGLCMHPVEHLYYFTSMAPSLYFCTTPFAFVWNGIHLIIAPGASHSGYEDHIDSDQHHYLHHRYFECNYGTTSFPLDSLFGTFRENLSTKSKEYHGNADGVGTKTAATLDRKATLLDAPEWDQLIFNLIFCIFSPALLTLALVNGSQLTRMDCHVLTSMVVLGPMVGAMLLVLLKSWTKHSSKRHSESMLRRAFYPFHKDGIPSSILHIVLGVAMGVVPAYHLIHMTLAQPGQGFYSQVLEPSLS
ncbi:unnamed protein product [Cylindrotheca closterium]|uniref:Fatty acid hydroxylase domain-containing protein n=1 Tax=Cylindrotheca closterium TaxID=2856 RepID=A0AAD2CBI4_9STRA|nr:unnamed protein product [Cylindrotheca closterium]